MLGKMGIVIFINVFLKVFCLVRILVVLKVYYVDFGDYFLVGDLYSSIFSGKCSVV